jgi:hypothetical protein
MDRGQLQAAGANYPNLQHQGLYGIPGGLLFVVLGLATLDQAPSPVVLVLALALVGGAFGAVYLYYARTLGIATPSRAKRRQYNIAAASAFATYVVLDQLARTLLGRPPEQSVSTVVAAWAIAVLVFHAMTVGLRPHYLAISAGPLIVAVLPIWTTGPDRDALSFLPIAAATALTGLVEHVRLTRWYRSFPNPGVGGLEGDRAGA